MLFRNPTVDNNVLYCPGCAPYLPQVHQVSNLLFVTVPVLTVVLQDEVLAKKQRPQARQWLLFSLMASAHFCSHAMLDCAAGAPGHRRLKAPDQNRMQHAINVQS